MKLSIIAHPNSKNPRIEKDLLGATHVYVNAPPLEGGNSYQLYKIRLLSFIQLSNTKLSC